MQLRPSIFISTVLTLTLAVAPALPAALADEQQPQEPTVDQALRQEAQAVINRGIAFLRETQNEDGSWSPDFGPAITALSVTAMLDDPAIGPDDPAVVKAIDYILARVKEDGGIYDNILQTYNTAISISALTRVGHREDVAQVIDNAVEFLKRGQWVDQADPQGNMVDENHPFYGGAGYGGRHGRPDMSNTQFMIQALHDAGIDCEEPVFVRAMKFITRNQGVPENDLFDETVIEQDGGFIYATSIDRDHIGVPQSMANPDQIDEARLGRPVSGLRTYGSITYAGFKSYIYAELDREDPRVVAAWNWIRNNYTLEQNPGMPEPIRFHGLFYYYLTFARALDAWGTPVIETEDGRVYNWRNDLLTTVIRLQQEDGSWFNEADRWMEGDANLVTAYAIQAMQHALY